MISVQESIRRLDRSQSERQFDAQVRTGYLAAIQACSEYAVECDSDALALLRQHVPGIAEMLQRAATTEELETVQASFRGELRDYRDRSGKWIAHLKAELDQALTALTTFASTVESNETQCRETVDGQLGKLDKVAATDDLSAIRKEIGEVRRAIAAGCEGMQKANSLFIAQLQDEIRTLHREMEQQKRVLFEDRSSGAWNRAKMDYRIDELLRLDEPFCMLVVWISNLKRVSATCSASLIEAGLKSFVKRFEGVTGGEAMVGRLGAEEFGAILETDIVAGRAIAGELNDKLSGTYAVQDKGVSQRINFRVTIGIVDHVTGHAPERFRKRLDQMAGVLAGAA